jgi:hypothetical protein
MLKSTFCHCDKIFERNHLKGGKIYVGSGFQKFQSKIQLVPLLLCCSGRVSWQGTYDGPKLLTSGWLGSRVSKRKGLGTR